MAMSKPSFAIAKHGRMMLWSNRYLIENLASSRNRFSEDSFLIGDRLRDHMQIFFGQGKEFPKRTIAPQNAEHSAFWTVALQPLLTILASLTGCVDLADDALPDHRGCGSGFDNANKFMSQHSGEAEVAFRDFKVRVADAGLQKADETFTPTGHRLRLVFDPEFAVKYQGSHSVCLIRH